MRLSADHVLPLAALVFLNGCMLGGGSRASVAPPPDPTGPAADYPMVIGEPFTIDGKTYRPEDKLNYDAVGYAEVSQDAGDKVSAAHKTLPLPSYVEVTSLESGRTILARVEERGPMSNDTLLELSGAAADQLGINAAMRNAVRVRRVNPPELERALLRRGERAPERMATPKPLREVLMRKLREQEPQVAERLDTPKSVDPDAAATFGEAFRSEVAPLATASVAASEDSPETKAEVHAVAEAAEPALKPDEPIDAGTGNVAEASEQQAPVDGLVVQAAAFSTEERAMKAASALGGFVRHSGRFWHLRIGPFADPKEADTALAKARSAGYTDARIQRAD
ncbi:septal ring lytic transglycosylase RlpA family protein [Novosphingobium marinum]|uniref:Rare lipoprotein A n=1 Tax=Novosphingobium marinum TaxID=1514948 RepID=A0A7Z0BUJ7_9SPHN|nr:SPOR domain-containing protein [Novosphingobium marinum]NYH94252.1 rare lipoprotein A [Novosphingobium marinum]